jgi:hypothetical protein
MGKKTKDGDGEKVKNRGAGEIFQSFALKVLENIQRSHFFAKIDLLRC